MITGLNMKKYLLIISCLILSSNSFACRPDGESLISDYSLFSKKGYSLSFSDKAVKLLNDSKDISIRVNYFKNKIVIPCIGYPKDFSKYGLYVDDNIFYTTDDLDMIKYTLKEALKYTR
jgi:hypothetical protein